jgi:hypothetical protein
MLNRRGFEVGMKLAPTTWCLLASLAACLGVVGYIEVKYPCPECRRAEPVEEKKRCIGFCPGPRIDKDFKIRLSPGFGIGL